MIETIDNNAFDKAFAFCGNTDKTFINETRELANKLVFELIDEVAKSAAEIKRAPADDEEQGREDAETWTEELLECLTREDLKKQAEKLLNYTEYRRSL